MSRRNVAAGGREEYYRPARSTAPARPGRPDRRPAMAERISESPSIGGDQNTLPMTMTMALLAVLAVVVAVDAQSVPMLSVFAILAFGGVIACIAIFG